MNLRTALLATAALLVLPSPAARATTLDDLRRSLATFPGAATMKVRIDTQQRKQSGKEKKESSGTVIAEDAGAELRLVHAKADLNSRLQKGHDDEEGLEAADALELINYSPRLTRLLDGATLTKTAQTSYEGAPATLFEVTPVREKSERTERFVKSFQDTLRIWVGAGGVPLAAERSTNLRAGILILNIETKVTESLRFVRAADHLLVTRHVTEMMLAGLGQDETGSRIAVVTVVP